MSARTAKTVFVNALTFLRVPLIFTWLALAVLQNYRGGFGLALAALAAMFLAAVTDAFDGALARRWNVVSQLGKMADPLMDKVFFVVSFSALAWMVAHRGGEGSEAHSVVMMLFTILYIVRDLWVTFMRSVGALFGADVAAMWLGKVRTALSFPAAGWIYLYLLMHGEVAPRWSAAWLWSCYAVETAMIVLNVVSFYTYTRVYMPYLKKALERR